MTTIALALASRSPGLLYASSIIGATWVARVSIYLLTRENGADLTFLYVAIDGVAAWLLAQRMMRPNFGGRHCYGVLIGILIAQGMWQFFAQAAAGNAIAYFWMMFTLNRLFEFSLLFLNFYSVGKIINRKHPEKWKAFTRRIESALDKRERKRETRRPLFWRIQFFFLLFRWQLAAEMTTDDPDLLGAWQKAWRWAFDKSPDAQAYREEWLARFVSRN